MRRGAATTDTKAAENQEFRLLQKTGRRPLEAAEGQESPRQSITGRGADTDSAC